MSDASATTTTTHHRSTSRGPAGAIASAIASVFQPSSASRQRGDSYSGRPSYDAGSRHNTNDSTTSTSNTILSRGRAGNPQEDLVREASRSASRSRGREAFSTGRGGAGNIKPSPSRGDAGVSDADMKVIQQAQERSRSRIRSSGRGGAGNVSHPLGQTPERVQEEADAKAYEDAVRKRHNETVGLNQSVGRGGAGNVASRSPSRQPASRATSSTRADPPRSSLSSSTQTPHQNHAYAHAHHIDLHSTGRGGSGNITSTTQPLGMAAEELEKARHYHATHDAAHGEHFTSGRGGFGNLHEGAPPKNIDVPPPLHEASEEGGVSTGRGGAGNISHGKDGANAHHGGVHGLIDKIVHPKA